MGNILITLNQGVEFVLESAQLSFKDGVLVLKDLYKFEEYRVVNKAQVTIKPTPPYRSPTSLTKCLALSLKSPIIVPSSSRLEVIAPFELEVLVNDKPISVLTPFKVKFTVIGTPSEGVLCRWFPSELVSEGNLKKAKLEVNAEVVGTALIKDIVIEDVNNLPMKSKKLKEGIQVLYGPVKGLFMKNHLIISQKKFQSKIIEVIKTLE